MLRVSAVSPVSRTLSARCRKKLNELHPLGYDGISFGTETGDDITLAYMNKGNTAADIVEQLHKLDNAGITYNIVFMSGYYYSSMIVK